MQLFYQFSQKKQKNLRTLFFFFFRQNLISSFSFSILQCNSTKTEHAKNLSNKNSLAVSLKKSGFFRLFYIFSLRKKTRFNLNIF